MTAVTIGNTGRQHGTSLADQALQGTTQEVDHEQDGHHVAVTPRRIFKTYSFQVSSTQPPGPEPTEGSTALEVPEPLELPLVPFAIAGMALWALAGLILLPFHGRL